jgi:hypothetical protein
MLNSAIHRLYETGVLHTCADAGNITSYTYAYTGRIADQQLTVDPRMKKSDLVRIAKRAADGSVSDMVTVSMLYNVGYGLPHDAALAKSWVSHATLTPAEHAFDDCAAQVIAHAQNNPDEIYPDSLLLPCLDIINKIHDFKHESEFRKGCYVMPRLDGIRVYLIYRHVPGVTPHLYAGFYRDEQGDMFLSFDKLVQLGAPLAFGMLGKHTPMRDYTPFGDNSMYVIAATIFIPESKREASTAVGENLWDIFTKFLNDDTVDREQSSFNLDFFEANLAESEKALSRIRRTVKRFQDMGEPVPVKHKKALREAKAAVERNAEYLKNTNPQLEYMAYMATRPRSYLRLLSHELYRWNRAVGLKTVPMSQIMQTHLSSMGFMSITHPLLEFAGFVAESDDVAKTVKLFERTLDAKVKALIIQPSPDASVRFVDVSRIDL